MTTTGGSSSSATAGMSEAGKKKFVMPTPAYMAPAGASLGQSVSNPAQSLVSTGRGSSINTTTGAERGTLTGQPMHRPAPARSLVSMGGGTGAVPTDVDQKPTPTTPAKPAPAKAGTAPLTPVTSEVGTGPARAPEISNNFLSIIGGAGGLGRRTSNAKRTLIGGA